ncbi:MAG: PhoX family protein [Woeseiaceae bacterium]|nr:PhoX family protein [Woeseiaceae bacterium]
MINRRRFLQSLTAAAAVPALTYSCQTTRSWLAPLQADPKRIIDVPEGFSYNVVSRVGDAMADGLVVPGAHDGMAAFDSDNGRIILLTNHELSAADNLAGPYAGTYSGLPESKKSRFYDRGEELTPGLGGTTTTIYNPATRMTERQFLSLGGTDTNCSGGKTPWGSWLSCEESFAEQGPGVSTSGAAVSREQRHGYVFEVPAAATELIKPVPLKAMGRFEHEAAAVHEPSGIVYLTEDKWDSLFYRFIPNTPGRLQEGGRLQALAVVGEAAKNTHNWEHVDIEIDEVISTHWIDLEDIDGDLNDLRLRGAANGAAKFARGEGITVADDRFAFTCTIGGSSRLGQIFTYQPSPFEGTDREQDAPGKLTLIAEASQNALLKNCDNLTMAPWGDLIVCEDTEDNTDRCALVGVRPDGSQYLVANNAYSASELAGVCFSPDGKTLFVNIQYPGMTVAITGPWPG